MQKDSKRTLFAGKDPVVALKPLAVLLFGIAIGFIAGWAVIVLHVTQEGTFSRIMLLVPIFAGGGEGVLAGAWMGYAEFRDSANMHDGRRVSSARKAAGTAAVFGLGSVGICLLSGIAVTGVFSFFQWDNVPTAIACYLVCMMLIVTSCMELTVAAFDEGM